jgi:NAD(P)-dependent dehydrogenase (short-subunit alcohol dehydrogenase family)
LTTDRPVDYCRPQVGQQFSPLLYMRELAEKVAVITGGGSGIGEALCRLSAVLRMKVVVADIDLTAAERVRASIIAAGGVAIAAKVDVSQPAEVEQLAEVAYRSYGGVHLLCNNAGIVPGGRHRHVWEYPLEDWRWTFDVNLMGVVHGLRSFVPRMLAQQAEAHIVNTASVAGLVSGPGSAVYGASKHAVVRVTEALYASLREMNAPIGVTALCPGLVNTRIYESERSRPEDLRPAAGVAAETPELRAVASDLYAYAMSPSTVAEQVFEAVREQRLYQITTPSYDDAIRDRADALLARRNPEFPNLLELSTRDRRA